MNSDDEHDRSGSPTALTGFLFGNIDERGHLEDDVLDEDCKKHLKGLNALGVTSFIKDLTAKEQTDSAAEDGDVTKAASAIDYSDEQEVAEDERVREALANIPAPARRDDVTDDYDMEESPSTTATSPSPTKPATDVTPRPAGDVKSPSKAYKAPLAAMCPQALADVDVQELFPEFRPGQVLRFSRLFKPVYMPNIYKKKKKKAENEDPSAEKEEVKVEIEQEEKKKHEPEVFYDPELPIRLRFGREAREDELAEDDEVKFLADPGPLAVPQEAEESVVKEKKPQVAGWRYGPAQLWYDMLGVNESGEDFNYGFKLKQDTDAAEKLVADLAADDAMEVDQAPRAKVPKVTFPEEAFLMITQKQWEDDVIWNGEEVKAKVMRETKERGAIAGWVPSSNSRTLAQYYQTMYGKVPGFMADNSSQQAQLAAMIPGLAKPEEWCSIFPAENYDLVYGRWEDDVIWDAENMDRIPKPKILTLDATDKHIIYEFPDDKDPSIDKSDNKEAAKEKKEMRRSRVLLNKSGLLKEEEEEEQEEEETAMVTKDPFNLSNDEFYNPKLSSDSRPGLSGMLLQHSTPAVELRVPYFPTQMGPMKLRHFHRPPLKKYSYGPTSRPDRVPIQPLLKHIRKKAKQRDAERAASGGGDMFFMRTADDLTGKDGELLLMEFSEEFPPVMSQVGMAAKIKNYYKRKPGKDANPPQFEYGELAYAHSSPFLGTMKAGQCVPALENHMYRAPIYQHSMPHTDFLVIRNRSGYWIREVSAIFTVGQECPLTEVPGPNSKKANNFIKDFLQVFVYRMFKKSQDNPPRIKMDSVKRAFGDQSESSIRKRLKLCADFKRTGTGADSNWWVLKPDFLLPNDEELCSMVTPEQCCTYYGMLAAEQRLKDAGYGDSKYLLTTEEADDEESQMKIDDEVRVAPWNTTRAYLAAMRGKCLLALSGVADPTGCGEGFSYVKVPNKPSQNKDDPLASQGPKKTVTGTDADLRRLPLKEAKNLLRKFGVAENEIKKLSRWDVIDVVRTLSTQQAKQGQEGMLKYARGNRFSVQEHHERYREESQRLFDLQNKVLSSAEVLSTDEEPSDDDSDFDEMGKNIESMLQNKKSSSQLSHEKEERERKELQKMMLEEGAKKKSKKEDLLQTLSHHPGRILKITRTFLNESGETFTRTEIVRKPAVIDNYVRVRKTKSNDFIKQFAATDDAHREEIRKQRRRLQEQLRRLKRLDAEKAEAAGYPGEEKLGKDKKKYKQKDLSGAQPKVKCSGCGAYGHMRTNRECPNYVPPTPEEMAAQKKRGPKPKEPSLKVAMTDQEEEMYNRVNLADEGDLVSAEDTKLKFSKKLLKHVKDVQRKSMLLRIPKNVAMKRRRVGTAVHCDYLHRPSKNVIRRRADPLITLTSMFERDRKSVV